VPDSILAFPEGVKEMADFHKFEFIYCVSNPAQFQDSWQCAGALRIPAGFAVSKTTLYDTTSICQGYNQAMRNSNAKYKIYLHQDVNILNPDFLHHILYLFRKYPNLGMLGVLGTKRLPPNGIWWEAEQQLGKVYFFNEALNCNMEITGEYEKVQVIDGMIMITQYDLPWREDLLKGWHFYDMAQSLEFIKAGYDVGVPQQATPWCSHNTTTPLIPFQENQLIFLNEYRQWIGS
jgi:hypothetical protein